MLFWVVVVGNELGVGCNQHIVLDGDASGTHEERVGLYNYILAYLHVLSAHHRRGSHQTASFAKLSEDFVNQFIILFGKGHGVVQLEAELNLLYALRLLLWSQLAHINPNLFHVII